MMTEWVFVPAPFIGLLADRPATSAPAEVQEAWLRKTHEALVRAVPGPHGLEAVRLATVVDAARTRLRGGGR